MSFAAENALARLRGHVYWIIALSSVGIMLGRILAVDSVDLLALEKSRIREALARTRQDLQKQGLGPDAIEQRLQERERQLQAELRLRRPFLSANDRSRWCTVRALVEPQMRVEGVPYAIDKVIQQPGWDTIDMVMHPGVVRDGVLCEGHLFSSKPPLLATLLAGPYWVIHRLTGATLGTHPYAIGRLMLILVNVGSLGVYFWLLARLVERFGRTDWGRLFVMAAAAFGTFLSTFAVAINNHLVAAVAALIAVYAAVRIWFDAQRRLRYFAVAGFFAALAAATELPALTLLAALGVPLLAKAPWRTLAAFLPAVLVVAAAFFGTNWIAHQSLRPPYMHRSPTDPEDNWYVFQYRREGKLRPSYWQQPQGIDRGEPSRGVYALHVLVGHHGIFSLTPVWVLSLFGLGAWIARPADRRLRELALLIAAVSLACLVFYIGILGQKDRNYGGMSSGFRWAFWLAPLWLLAMLPAADATARRGWTRLLASGLLVLSVLSASYPTWNPWTHPWVYNFLSHLGWIAG